MFVYSDGSVLRTFMSDLTEHMNDDIGQMMIQIDEDRYGGSYSGFQHTAWLGRRPFMIDGPNPDCDEFWEKWKDKALYGGGNTPQEAFKDLTYKVSMSDLLLIEPDHPEMTSLSVIIVYSNGRKPKTMLYDSDEFRNWLG